jgi:hypothetical protein
MRSTNSSQVQVGVQQFQADPGYNPYAEAAWKIQFARGAMQQNVLQSPLTIPQYWNQ